MFTKLKHAFNRAIASLDSHSEIVRAQTEALKLQTEVVRALIPEIKTSIAAVEKQVTFLADSERYRLQRDFPTHDFLKN